MINITKYKNKEKSTVEYELEVTKENKIIFSTKFEIDKNTDDKICDRIAKIKLLNILMEEGSIDIYEELSKLIPVYQPKVNWTKEAREEYLRTQKDNFLY